ncbi:expressed protein [Echinococcus multilocularis]|uniref:Expressed protein n=1 Tax=Echinococcus multilocularis TaxID=6211 RepID=A0A068XZ60_ECHMU|nr:expressed protein [Echinococcus multilocularis]
MDPYKCVICSETFRTYNLLRAHESRVHQFSASLHGRCPVCSAFPESTGLTLVHQKAANHNECCVCSKRYRCFDLLLIHFIEKHMTEGTEDSEKRIYCTECSSVHPTREALLEHIRSSHLNCVELPLRQWNCAPPGQLHLSSTCICPAMYLTNKHVLSKGQALYHLMSLLYRLMLPECADLNLSNWIIPENHKEI